MIILSICIPTYNRAAHLRNCLSSLIQCGLGKIPEVQVCISDNCSTDATKKVVIEAEKKLALKYKINKSNFGFARNMLEVVQMADGQFVWVLGDDDLLIAGACEKIIALIKKYRAVDFFVVNSKHLSTEYVHRFPQPFDLSNLPRTMEPFSLRTECGEMPFLKLIDPKICFDYLGGIYLSVFRRSLWLANTGCLDETAIYDDRSLSHPDNTFPHVKIFAHAFSKSTAYFSAEPASVSLTGAQEWSAKGPLIMSIRLPEALEEYKNNGLTWRAYWYCRNAVLSNFFLDLIRLVFDRKNTGGEYVKISKVLVQNCIYPNFYLSFFYPFFRRTFWIKIRGMFLSIFFRLVNKVK